MLLLKPPIEGTELQHKREEAEGRWSTESLCVCGRTDAGAAVDSPDAPRCPFLPLSPQSPQPCCHSDLFLCHTVPSAAFFPVGLCGFSGVSSRVGLSLVALTSLLSSAEYLQEMFDNLAVKNCPACHQLGLKSASKDPWENPHTWPCLCQPTPCCFEKAKLNKALVQSPLRAPFLSGDFCPCKARGKTERRYFRKPQ